VTGADGTFEGRVEDKRSNAARWMVALTAIGLAACVIAIATVAIVPAKPTALYAAMDKRDGTDALVNAILVARGDRCDSAPNLGVGQEKGAQGLGFVQCWLSGHGSNSSLGYWAGHATGSYRAIQQRSRRTRLAVLPA
jgi:hypothetical protein